MLLQQHDQLAISFALSGNCLCMLPACHDYQAKLYYPVGFEPLDTNLYTCTGNNMDCLLQTPAEAFRYALLQCATQVPQTKHFYKASSPYHKDAD